MIANVHRLAVFALFVLLAACAESAADDPRPHVEGGACRISAMAAADAWEALVGPLPAGCWPLLEAYDIRFVGAAEMPCEVPGEQTNGCSRHAARAVYLLDGLDETGVVNVMAHEWTHVLAHCARGDGDGDHVDGKLWDGPGTSEAGGWGSDLDTVVGLARANSSIGPCL